MKSTQRTIGRVVAVSVGDRKGVKKANIKSVEQPAIVNIFRN